MPSPDTSAHRGFGTYEDLFTALRALAGQSEEVTG